MGETLQIRADLEFSVDVDGRQMCGALRGSGSDLELHVSDAHLFGGTGSELAHSLADQLATQGLRVAVVADDRHLATVGSVTTSFWQRRLTGSRHIHVSSVGAALRLLRLRRASSRATPLVPPPTPTPLLPTFLRRRVVPTTTHDPDRGGYPRLVLQTDQLLADEQRPVFNLGALTSIGGGSDADIRLRGLAPLVAEVRQTEDDEFVIRAISAASGVRVNGAVLVGEAQLRTGARVEVGPWVLSFTREEYADHGRPYGGRIGGELGRQLPQPPREVLQGPTPA